MDARGAVYGPVDGARISDVALEVLEVPAQARACAAAVPDEQTYVEPVTQELARDGLAEQAGAADDEDRAVFHVH